MSSDLTFGSWNPGSNVEDYKQLFLDKEDIKNQTDEELNIRRNQLLDEVAKQLVMKVDVMALQEVSGDERTDIQVFLNHKFQIIRPFRETASTYTDTAIAINLNKFKEEFKNNRSFYVKGLDFAAVVVTEKQKKYRNAFISGHLPGFNLEERDQEKLKEEASSAYKIVQGLITHLEKNFSDCDRILIGIDMNHSPEIYSHSFNLFREAGFELYRSGKPTNHLSRDFKGNPVTLSNRELDYILVKHQNLSHSLVPHFFRKIFTKNVESKVSIVEEEMFTLDVLSSPSDHLPIFVRIEENEK